MSSGWSAARTDAELAVHAEPAGAALRLAFRCEPLAHFLGFGEQYNALDHRGWPYAPASARPVA